MKIRIALLLLTLFIFSCSKNDQSIKNIESFTKLYGYVRYFYPGDEASKLNWEKFAVLGCKEVETCKNNLELKQKLEELFLPIAPGIQIVEKNEKVQFNLKNILPANIRAFDTVSWQHLGYGYGSLLSNYDYNSTRLNRPYEEKQPAGFFGAYSIKIDIEQYRGKEIEFTTVAKKVSTAGKSLLWLRYDNKENKMCEPRTSSESKISTYDWSKYILKSKIHPEAKNLIFGAEIEKNGKFFFDSICVKVRSGNSWITIYSNNFDADKPDSLPNNIIPGLYNTWIKNQGYDLKVVEDEKSNKCLVLKNAEQIINYLPERVLFPNKLKLGEYVDKEIGSGLRCIVPLALPADSLHTYPLPDNEKLQTLNKKLESIDLQLLSGDDLYTRLADVTITWTVIQHFSPIFEYYSVDWNKMLTETIEQAFKDKTTVEFGKTLRRMVAGLNDGHCNLFMPDEKGEDGFLPLKWEIIENQLVITDVYDSLTPFKKGDIVKSINGENAVGFYKNKCALISASSEECLKFKGGIYSVSGQLNDSVNIEIEGTDSKNKIIMAYYSYISDKYEAFLTLNTEPIQKLEDGIYYINDPYARSMDKVMAMIPEFENCKGIIFNARGYMGFYEEFFNHFYKSPDTAKNLFNTPEIIYPDRENMVNFNKSGGVSTPAEPYIKAKLLIIINGNAISWAESVLTPLKHYKLAQFVGQQTSGTNGNTNSIKLPGNYEISWTAMKTVNYDGSRFWGMGVQPDYPVRKTIDGIRKNKDESLEKAKEVMKKLILENKHE